MSFHMQECQKCGATAFEIPDEDGRTICAVCGAEPADLDVEPEMLADEYDREVARPRHRPQVRGMRGRSVPAQISERIGGASRTVRDYYDEQDDDSW